MKKRTRMKSGNMLKGKRLFTDFGDIGYYKVLKIYDWKEYRDFSDNEIIEWHIGTHTKEESVKIKNIINYLISA